MVKPTSMQIGELSSKSGVPRHTIHYYVKKGLLSPPVKTGKTRAYYNESHLERLRTISDLKRNFSSPLAFIRAQLDEGGAGKGKAFPVTVEAADRPERQTAKYTDRKRKIIEAAIELFSSKGYYRTNVKDIADAAHISTGTFYKFFQSKQELFAQSVAKALRDTLDRVELVIDRETDFFKRNKMRLKALDENYSRFSEIFTQLRAEAVSEERWAKKNVEKVYDELTGPIMEEMRKAMKNGLLRPVEVNLLAYSLIGMVDVLLLRKNMDERYDLEQIFTFLFDLLMNGLRPVAGSPGEA